MAPTIVQKQPDIFCLTFCILLACSGCVSPEKEPTPSLPEATVVVAPPKTEPILTEVKRIEDIKISNLEMQKFAYELGFDPKKELTQEQKQQIVDRKKLRQLERALDTQIESSGNAIYKNERWQYLKQISTPQGYRQQSRLVYFEGGRVVGWETE